MPGPCMGSYTLDPQRTGSFAWGNKLFWANLWGDVLHRD